MNYLIKIVLLVYGQFLQLVLWSLLLQLPLYVECFGATTVLCGVCCCNYCFKWSMLLQLLFYVEHVVVANVICVVFCCS